MAAPSYSLPTIGSDTSVSDPLIRTALSDLKTLLTGNLDADNIAAGAVGTSELAAGAATDAKLASPNNSVYRTLLSERGFLTRDAAAGTYILGMQNQSAGGLRTSGDSVFNDPYIISPPNIIYFDDSDYTVTDKAQKLRLRATVASNATAPGMNFTFGLYPVTVAGGADVVAVTLGTVVSASTVAINTPSASTVTSGATADLSIPADGAYALGVVTSGSLTNNAAVVLNAHLQTRHV